MYYLAMWDFCQHGEIFALKHQQWKNVAVTKWRIMVNHGESWWIMVEVGTQLGAPQRGAKFWHICGVGGSNLDSGNS